VIQPVLPLEVLRARAEHDDPRSVTVVTSARPDRLELLEQCIASVAAQTLRPELHLIGIDQAGAGGAATKNRLVRAVGSTWTAFLDDDDVLGPDHLETLLAHAGDDVDLVWSLCAVEGRDWEPDHCCDLDQLEFYNFIPVAYLVRTKAYLAVGGMPEGDVGAYDWRFLKALLAAGGHFRCVHEVTWTYRFLGANHSMGVG
jgi:glycosyltransferase involved in cell wall biosynthesis